MRPSPSLSLRCWARFNRDGAYLLGGVALCIRHCCLLLSCLTLIYSLRVCGSGHLSLEFLLVRCFYFGSLCKVCKKEMQVRNNRDQSFRKYVANNSESSEKKNGKIKCPSAPVAVGVWRGSTQSASIVRVTSRGKTESHFGPVTKSTLFRPLATQNRKVIRVPGRSARGAARSDFFRCSVILIPLDGRPGRRMQSVVPAATEASSVVRMRCLCEGIRRQPASQKHNSISYWTGFSYQIRPKLSRSSQVITSKSPSRSMSTNCSKSNLLPSRLLIG